MPHDVTQSPFFSRAYGGYTTKQIAYYENLIPAPAGKRILDSMAGQAFALSQLAHQGADLTIVDVNPAPLLLAGLRDPEIIRDREKLLPLFNDVLQKLRRKRRPKLSSLRVDDWLSSNIKADIDDFARLFGIGLFPPMFSNEFWNEDKSTRFAVSLLVLAARKFVCFQKSDNVTWLTPGGIAREHRIVEPLKAAMEEWMAWASETEIHPNGRMTIHSMSIEEHSVPARKTVDFVVTSPPYANRLDYTRLWAPETAVISYLCGHRVEDIRQASIGSNFVAGTSHYEEEVRALPRRVKQALNDIRDDTAKYSKSYYYPFFRNYAISLSHALRNSAASLKAGGQMIVFLRDTVRKDVLFPSGDLVKSVLTSKSIGLKHEESVRHVIKGHIGNVRRITTPGIYGLAQVEWWLRFRKAGG
jgi:hypothetical protein